MNRSQLVRALADQLGLKINDAEVVIDTLVQICEVTLACGESITIPNFGRFDSRLKKETNRTNPRTGELIKVEAKRGVVFVPAPQLKKRVNRRSVDEDS